MAVSRARPRVDLTAERCEALWADLADARATRAYEAVLKLAEAPRQAVPFLRQRLQPVAAADPKRIARLLDDLDSAEFPVRQKASAELEQLGALAAPALRKALAGDPPLEVRRRVEELLQKLQRRQVPAETLRALRAVEVLESVGTPEVRRVLETLAKGVPEAPLTKQARAALERLATRGAAAAR